MRNAIQANASLAARICMVAGLLVTGVIALRSYLDDEARIHQEFVHEIDTYAASVDEQINEDIAVLHSLKVLFDASEVVTRAEFHTFASFLLSRYPTMQAVGWVPRIPAHERRDVEMRAQNDGFDGFLITERDEQGALVSAGQRDEYYPVYFLEPMKGNQAALGFDLASNPVRREALHAARDNGDARATARISLVQEPAKEWSVLILIPVYDGAPTGTDERRGSIQGVVSGVFRLHDLLAAAGAHVLADGMVEMRLFDEFPDGSIELLHDAETIIDGPAKTFRHRKCLRPVAGRQWSLIATPSRAYVSRRRTITPYVTLLVGFLVTGWLSFYLTRLVREKKRVEQQVDLRTRELREQSVALAESNANQKRELAERRRLQKQFAAVTDREQRRLGQELHDSAGQQIAVSALLAQHLHQQLAAAEAPAAKHLPRLTASIQSAQAQVRALSKGLLPVAIDRGGLKAALGELTANVGGLSGVEVEFECDEDIVVDDAAVATQLYRIAQEALRNALKHGDVSRTTISLSRDERGLTLAIRDDGKGFSKGASTSGSGLSIMRHRADLIGATFDIESPEGQGTSVICCLPHSENGAQ